VFFAITWNFFAAAVLTVPFLVLGARIEGDGSTSMTPTDSQKYGAQQVPR
jgi:hypothetical protein